MVYNILTLILILNFYLFIFVLLLLIILTLTLSIHVSPILNSLDLRARSSYSHLFTCDSSSDRLLTIHCSWDNRIANERIKFLKSHCIQTNIDTNININTNINTFKSKKKKCLVIKDLHFSGWEKGLRLFQAETTDNTQFIPLLQKKK